MAGYPASRVLSFAVKKENLVSVMITTRFGLPGKMVTIKPKSVVTMLRNGW